MKLQILLAVASVALSVIAQASDTVSQPDQYLCIVDKATGFKYNSQLKEWTIANFKTDSKYLISVSRKPGKALQITEVGKSLPFGFCEEGFSEYGFLFCHTTLGEFRFNRGSGRFLLVYPVGYYNVGSQPQETDEVSDTPYLEIGKCSRF